MIIRSRVHCDVKMAAVNFNLKISHYVVPPCPDTKFQNECHILKSGAYLSSCNGRFSRLASRHHKQATPRIPVCQDSSRSPDPHELHAICFKSRISTLSFRSFSTTTRLTRTDLIRDSSFHYNVKPKKCTPSPQRRRSHYPISTRSAYVKPTQQ